MAAIAVVCATNAGAAFAQEAPATAPAQQPPQQSDASNSNEIQEIVVTARREAETSRDVPLSIQALGSETIARRNVVALEDLSAYTPNFRQTSAIISPYRAMRGISSGSNFSFDQAVGAFTDGIYIGRAQLGRMPFFDIERVEVLRGPQIILFGNSTTAGAINNVTREPGREFNGFIRTSYEFENRESIFEGAVTVPVTDTFSVRVAGFSQILQRGWLRSNFDGRLSDDPRINTQALRVTAQWRPVDELTATIRYEKADIDVDGGLQQAVQNRLNNPLVGEINFDNFRFVGSGPPLGISDQRGVQNDIIRLAPEIISGTIRYEFGDYTLTSTTSHVSFDYSQSVESDWIPAAYANIVQNEGYSQFSQEIRLAGRIGTFLNFQTGGYYQRDTKTGDLRFDFNFPAAGTALPPFGLRNDARFENESWSVFADLTFNLSERFRIGLGARYQEANRIYDQSNRANVVGTGAFNTAVETTFVAPGRSIFSLVGGNSHTFVGITDSESHFQPQALVQFDVTPDVMTYARFVRGAKAGGYDWSYRGADPRGGIFLPEIATSYELGIKGLLFDRTLSFELQAFRTEFDNLQVSAFDGVASLVVRNAAAQVSQGFELETTWRITPQLTFNLSGAYLDAKYTDFPAGSCNFFSRRATPAGTVCSQDYTGTRPAFQSMWSGNFGLQYDADLGNLVLRPRADFNYRSSYNASTNNDPDGIQPGYITIDTRLELTPHDGPWTLAVFGKNITNRRYMEFYLDAPGIEGLSSAVINRGRQIGLQLSTRF